MLRVAFILILLLLPSVAHAEKRVALVVGNAAYQYSGALANPVNDARDLAIALRGLGFQVILGTDLDKRGLDLKIREFARALQNADVGLFFYAGHGLQVTGANYLVATDAKLEGEGDLDFETVKADSVISHMEREAKTNIVFLDACRNNPLVRNLARTMGTRGVSENNGLAPLKSGLGTFIAFATQPGNVASDGTGRNSPFTAALKRHIAVPGVSLSDAMIEVRNEVVGATRGAQVPWDHSALRGRFYFSAGQPSLTPPPRTDPRELERAAAFTSETEDRTRLEEFIKQFGDSAYAPLARARIVELDRKRAALVRPTPPAIDPARVQIPTNVFFKGQTSKQTLSRHGDFIGFRVLDQSGMELGSVDTIIGEEGKVKGFVFLFNGKRIGLRSDSSQVLIDRATQTMTLQVGDAVTILTALGGYVANTQ